MLDNSQNRRLHGQLARILRRFPWSGYIIQRTFRVVQPRFTVGVVGVLLDEKAERVLLVEHVLHPKTPWGLPGGWIARGEDPAQTVEREFLEETGLRVRAVYPLLAQRAPDLAAHMDIVYRCVLDGEEQTIHLSHELLNYNWTPCDDLPPMVLFHEESIRAARDGAGCNRGRV